MNVEEVRQICIAKKGVTEGFPFDETTLVLKVGGKIFALLNLDKNPSVNLKCDPERAMDLREHHDAILPGYHMNKQHWNTVLLEGELPNQLVSDLIGHSYDLVYQSLQKKIKDEVDKEESIGQVLNEAPEGGKNNEPCIFKPETRNPKQITHNS